MNVQGTLNYAGDFRLPVARAEPPAPRGATVWDGDGFGFSDLLDIVNPLQHLPVVSSVYRQATDDQIGGIPRLLGGLLFGGPLGLVFAAINLAIQAISGRDVGEHVTAAFMGPPSETLGREQRMLAWWPEAPREANTATAERQVADSYRKVAYFVLEPPDARATTMTA